MIKLTTSSPKQNQYYQNQTASKIAGIIPGMRQSTTSANMTPDLSQKFILNASENHTINQNQRRTTAQQMNNTSDEFAKGDMHTLMM